MSVHNFHLQPLQAPFSDPEAEAWFDQGPKPTSFDWLWYEADTREYFAHRIAPKPPRCQSKKLLEVYQEQVRANGHQGPLLNGSEVLRRVWQTARENATPFTPMGELL
jgi:hypothetical protein